MNKGTGDAVSPGPTNQGVPLMPAKITRKQFKHLLRKTGTKIENETGSCRLTYSKGDREFVMMGPTGVHSLYAGATDLHRLNAHWTHFAAN